MELFTMSPFKVLKSFSDKRKAEEYMQQFLHEGVESQIVSSPKTPNQFDVAVIDPVCIDEFFRKTEQQSMQLEKCPACGKNVNENRFFKCVVCGFWECEACGTQRLFPKGLPAAHTCGEDEFEFLGNIGNCRSCQRSMAFRSIPQSLRVQMAGKTLIGRLALSTPLVGFYIADLMFVRKEIEMVLPKANALVKLLHSLQGNWDAWRKAFDSVMSNYQQLSWSADYINTMTNNPLFGMLGFKDTGSFFQKMGAATPYSHPLLMFYADLLKNLSNVLSNKISGPEYLKVVNDFQWRLNWRPSEQSSDTGTNPFQHALQELADLGENPGSPENLPKLAQILTGIFPVGSPERSSAGATTVPIKPATNIPKIMAKPLGGKICPKCSTALPPDAKFCNKCGTKL